MDIDGAFSGWEGTANSEQIFDACQQLTNKQLDPIPPPPKLKKKHSRDFIKRNKTLHRDREDKHKSSAVIIKNKLEFNLSGWIPEVPAERMREPFLPRKLQKAKLQPLPPPVANSGTRSQQFRQKLHDVHPPRKQRSSVCHLILRIEEERERIEKQSTQLADMLVKERQQERLAKQQAAEWKKSGRLRTLGHVLPLLPPRKLHLPVDMSKEDDSEVLIGKGY